MSDTAYHDPEPNPREQELLWPARQHPDSLILPTAYSTRFPGTWVAIFEGSVPFDQRNALFVEGYQIYRIRLIGDEKAQVIIRENPRPDRDGEPCHDATDARYDQYDPRGGRE